MAFQAVRVTREVTPGVYQATPPAGDVAHIRIHTNNSFPGRPTPVVWYVRDATTSNRRVQTGTSQVRTEGRLRTLFYFSQAKLLIPWACNLTGAGGGGVPLGLSTLTFDHMYQLEDAAGTLVRKRYLGATCRELRLSANNNGDGVLCVLDFTFDHMTSADITATDFPNPVYADYPADQPITFEEMQGQLTLGTARTNFSSFDLRVTNINRVLYDEFKYPQAIKWCGRDLNADIRFRYKSQADRTDFENQAAKTFSGAFTDGTNTVTFNFEAQARITNVEDDTPLDNASYQAVSVSPMFDPAATTDLTVTVAP